MTHSMLPIVCVLAVGATVRELGLEDALLRVQSVIAAGALLLVGLFVAPACSTSTADGPGCTNGARDEGEEGIDCGGVCPSKCTGAGCAANEECASVKCENGTCAAPAGKTCGVGVGAPCNDGDACELDKDCTSSFCDGGKCGQPAAGSHTDGQKNGGETGIDCGGSVKTTQPCPDRQGCTDSMDCVGTCNAGTCGPIGPTDDKKNGDETDIDCGGPTAPKCANGKACVAKADCADDYCPDDTKKCTAPNYSDGVQNGKETDVDCGGSGAGMKTCAETKNCVVDTDCNGACNYKKKCVDAPSCKGQFGSETCGSYETPDAFKKHESCCRTLPVAGYTDPNAPGKAVYLDKYEITAGRMRAFLEKLGGGVDAAGNAKAADVKAWVAAHRPARWNNGWDNVLPAGNTNSTANYTIIDNLVVDPLYPGPRQYDMTQKLRDWRNNPGSYSVDVGIFRSLGAPALFPEYTSTVNGGVYSVAHALNCTNTHGGSGQSTYWFDAATINQYSEDGSVGKYFSKEQLDEKALNCTSFAMFAAFCAWDGGQIATSEVIDYITENTSSPVYGPNFTQNGKLAVGNTVCGGATHNLLTFNDGGSYPCSDVYYYPNDMGNDYDASFKVAPGGRVPADVIVRNAGDEPWMDMIGNLEEAVLNAGETARFDWRGYGHEYNSIGFHRLQMSTPRGKGGAFGARCMRFK